MYSYSYFYLNQVDLDGKSNVTTYRKSWASTYNPLSLTVELKPTQLKLV